MSHSSSPSESVVAPTMSLQAIESMVRSTLAKRLKKPLEEITAETQFDDLGVDSLDMAELFFLLEDQLQSSIPLEQGVRLRTVGDAVTLVADHLASKE